MVIDVQEKLAAAMPKAPLAELEKNAAVLIRAPAPGDPVIATEQYPKGLGHTVASLRELLPQEPMTKMEFSCGASKPIAAQVLGSGRKQVVVVGWRRTSASSRRCGICCAAASPCSSRRTRCSRAPKRTARGSAAV